MLGNDQIGDCAVVATAHLDLTWLMNAWNRRPRFTNRVIETRYSEISGYVPGDASTDVGCNMRDVLKYWLKNPLATHSLTAFARIDVPNQLSVSQMRNFKAAVFALGGVYVGFALPLTAQAQIENGESWDLVVGTPDAERNSWGGHAVACVGFDDYGIDLVTWGRRQRASWQFVREYADEIWALIASQDWIHTGKSPSGFDLPQLVADLQALRAGA